MSIVNCQFLKPKVLHLNLFLLLFHKGFRFLMDRIAFDIDSAEGTGGTDVFAAAAADTDVLVYVRDSQSVFIGNHREGLRRAMLGAGAAACAVEMDDAVFFDEDDLAHLGAVLLLDRQRFDGAVGTDVAADRTIVVAETLLEINRGLHDTAEAVFQERRLQDVRRALADTEVARGTILLEMRETDGARRRNRMQTLVGLDTVVVADNLGRGGHHLPDGSRRSEAGDEEAAFGGILDKRLDLRLGCFRQGITQGTFLAAFQAIETIHATGIINLLVLAIDAGSLAARAADHAVRAFLRIDANLEKRETAEETQQRPDRAHRVAPRPPVFPSQITYPQERNQPDKEREAAEDRGIHAIERIIIEARKDSFEQIVPQHINRLEHIRYHAPERTVWFHQAQEECKSAEKREQDDSEDRPPQYLLLRRELEAFPPPAPFLPFAPFPEFGREPRYDILEYAHRTDDGAIDSPEDQRQGDKDEHRNEAERN